MTIIMYDDAILQAYEAHPINFDINHEMQHFTEHSLFCGNFETHFRASHELRMGLSDITKAELDPTTMKRIARYNLEKENEVLTKEIAYKEARLQEVKEEIKREKNRLSNILSVVKQFVNSDCDTVEEMMEYGSFAEE